MPQATRQAVAPMATDWNGTTQNVVSYRRILDAFEADKHYRGQKCVQGARKFVKELLVNGTDLGKAIKGKNGHALVQEVIQILQRKTAWTASDKEFAKRQLDKKGNKAKTGTTGKGKTPSNGKSGKGGTTRTPTSPWDEIEILVSYFEVWAVPGGAAVMGPAGVSQIKEDAAYEKERGEFVGKGLLQANQFTFEGMHEVRSHNPLAALVPV